MARRTAKEASDPLLWIQNLVWRKQYIMRGKVYGSIANGVFSREDVVRSILNGRIIKKQKDELKEAVDGMKYVICGPSPNGLAFETAGKIVEFKDGTKYVVITGYRST